MPFVSTADNDLPNTSPRPNWAMAFSHRPELLEAWTILLGVIKVRMQPRRYELVTLATALALRSSYCALAHGSVLRAHFTDQELEALLRDGPQDEGDRAVMDYARAIALDAASIEEGMVERLRDLGLQEGEICDIAATAAARCFFSKYLDALGVQPDSAYGALPDALRNALTPGRPIED